MNELKEIEVTYKNWRFDDVVLDLARHINNGFTIASYRADYSYRESELTFTLVETYKK